jgi:hypothetical protein
MATPPAPTITLTAPQALQAKMDHKKQLQAIYTEALHHGINARLGVDHVKAFQAILSHHYPSYAVVQLDLRAPNDFEEFVKVSEGSCIRLDLSDGHVIRTRTYEYPKDGRVRKGTGKAREQVRFGRYDLTWEDKEFVLYKFTYNDNNERSRDVWHILYPLALTTLTDGGDCPEIDALIVALGSWAAMPHEDIQVRKLSVIILQNYTNIHLALGIRARLHVSLTLSI